MPVMSPPFLLNLHPHTKYYNMYLRINFTVLIPFLSKHAIYMRLNEQCCSFTHGEVRAGRFDPEVFVNCLQNDKDKDLRVETSCSHLPVCKAAVLLIKSHVDSRNTAMSLYQII